MRMKCPYCGSTNTAKIIRGMPDYTALLEMDKRKEKYIIGGCCITGNDPAYKCLECYLGFGTPPVLKGEEEEEAGDQILLSDIITEIWFAVGGFFDGYDHVRIIRKGDKRVLCAYHVPPSDDEEPFVLREFSAREWKALMNKLFCRLFVHEWKHEYSNDEILDGTQWYLELRLDGRKDYVISGSNAFPPLYGDLEKMFLKYLRESVPLEMDPAKRAMYKFLFSDCYGTLAVIQEKFKRADMNAGL